jgi:hypothetical protein
MNDEATTHFASIIDNMEFGMNWLREHLGTIVNHDLTSCFLFYVFWTNSSVFITWG